MRSSLPLVEPLQRALHLRSVDLFADLAAPELAAMSRLMSEEWLRRGDLLFDRGQRVGSVHLLVEGRVRLEQGGGGVRRLRAPDNVGVVELLAGIGARARAVVETNTLALTIDGGALIDLIEDRFPVFVQIRAALGRQLDAQRRRLGGVPWPPRRAREAASTPTGALGLAEQLIWLHRVPELRRFGVGVLAALLRDRATARFEPGETIWRRDTPSEGFLVVVDGAVRCGGAAEGIRGEAGSILGLDEAFGGLENSCDLCAETAVTAIRVEVPVLLDVAEDHFHVAAGILAHCARTLLSLQQRERPSEMALDLTPTSAPSGGIAR